MSQNGEGNRVVPLAVDDVDRAAATLRAAFDPDPIYTHVFPAAEDRDRYLPDFWRAIVGLSRVYGETYTIDNGDAVAGWIPPHSETLGLLHGPAELLTLQAAVGRFPDAARAQFLAISNYADGLHPQLMQGRPHWYLWYIGVRPERQGQGLGAALIRPMLARADAEGFPIYLETESEGNVAFYRRLGFDVVHSSFVPDDGLPLWMMVREVAG